MGFRMALVTDVHIARLLLRAVRAVQATYIERLQQRGHPGLRTGHIPVLAGLDPEASRADTGVARGTRITDLANRAGMTRQMMGRLVRELETLGYLTTAAHPEDQRAVVVTMTERGHAIRTEAADVITELEADYAVLLHDTDLAALKGALQAIIRSSPTA
jgi:DNA-binding MarR family transcriptional regulator